MFRTILKLLVALAMLSPAHVAFAQQNAAAPSSQPAPVAGQPPVQPATRPAIAPAVTPAAQVPASGTPASQAVATAASPADATADNAGKSPKPSVMLREFSPWSMFLSADIVVKVVMIGLAFASLMTWTIFIAKLIELSIAQGKMRRVLRKVADSRSLAEAQLALGAKDSVLSSLLNAAMREARLSAGISSDSGIKERAASSFAEIVRAEARRIRIGMSILATIGATSPFVGLFGTVWGIMNSFIGISKSQTTNLAVVAPGIAEALLATAIGLVAAIPAVIIYNHFARVTKSYLELVTRASGVAARLLSRDLDRTHGGAMSRAAE
jgi:biopolymer transport protein ExbB